MCIHANDTLCRRVLRPDRLTAAIRKYVGRVLGPDFVKSQPFNLARSCTDAGPSVPVFVFLSPGVDVAVAVEALGAMHGMTADAGKYCSVSLGQVCDWSITVADSWCA